MRVLEIASEAVPFAKTGGLADVARALPEALAELGCDVTLMVPAYAEALGKGLPIEPAGIEFDVPIGTGSRRARILRCRREGQRADVYLIANDDLFDRPTLYGGASDYPDNAERFIFFSQAAVELACRLGGPWDILHCHDWQTGLVPAYGRLLYGSNPAVANARTVMTIHNMAYQGLRRRWIAVGKPGRGSIGWLENRAVAEQPVSAHIERELRSYLTCGILCFGFGRARCASCGQGFVVAFSCKGRGVCPSCNGRRMAQTAAHLVARVIPPVPVRQWVISVPKRLRCFLADRPSTVAALTRIFIEEIERLLCTAAGPDPCRRQAERSSPATRRRLLSAPLRIGAQSPCAPACVRDRRRLRANR